MDQIDFKKLLFKVAFCTMACDGHVDDREIQELKSIDANTAYFKNIDLSSELAALINNLNKNGTNVIEDLFSMLKVNELNAIQELLILEVSLRIINADDKHDENEIRFINLLRAKLDLHDEMILDRFGEIDILHTSSYAKSIVGRKDESISFDLSENIDFKKVTFDI